MSEYVYTQLDNPGSQIRLLTIPWSLNRHRPERLYEPLTGRLSHHHLPRTDLARTSRFSRSFKFPTFMALSYVWGDPTKSHEIFIDGKRLLITANLHAALWRLHIDSISDIRIWADAICINQEDLAERSAQIQVMRQVYYLASSVRIWLGISKRESSRSKEEKANPNAPVSPVTVPAFKKIFLIPAVVSLGVAGRVLIGLGGRLSVMADAVMNDTDDDKKVLIPTTDQSYKKPIEKLIAWSPSPHDLEQARLKEVDFVEIAKLINQWLIKNPDWFRRMWVVQELGAASNVFVQLGRCTVTWPDFLRTVYYLHYNCKSPVNDISRVTGLEQIRSSWNRGRRPPLQHLIQECRLRRSSDPKDKIYALLGLMGDPMNDFLKPDYSKSISEVYTNVTRHFITQTESLNPICGQQIHGRREELPSWVPDFQLDQNLTPSPLVDVSGYEDIFFASGRDKQSKYSIPKTTVTQQLSALLSVQGILIGTVRSISVVLGREKHRPLESLERKWHRILVVVSGLLGTPQGTNNSLAQFSQVIHEYIEFLNSKDPPPLQFTLSNEAFSRDLFSIDNDNIVTAYLQSLLCGRISPRERLSDKDIAGILDSFNVRHSLEYLEKLPAAISSGIRGRRLIITEAGHIGTAPEQTEASDLVCVSFGCSVPIVLRPIPYENMYGFVGECYLHGFMDGEAITGFETGMFTIHDFVLK